MKLSAVSVEQFRQFGINGFLRPGNETAPVILEVLPDDLDQIEFGAVWQQIEEKSLVVHEPAVQCVLIDAVMDARIVGHDHGRPGIALPDQRVEKANDVWAFDRAGAPRRTQSCCRRSSVLPRRCGDNDGWAQWAEAIRVVTRYAERAAMRKNPPRRDRTDDTGHRGRRPEACRACCASFRIPLRCAFLSA